MKVLYVGGMSGPLKDILSGKKENEITHAAQFFYPWYKLVQAGHQVDFVVTSNFNGPYEINVDWFSEKNLYANVYDPYSELPWHKRIFRRIKRLYKVFHYTNKAIKENEYDFIYCLTYYEGLIGNLLANYYKIPCGMRSMGTMLYEDFKNMGHKKTMLRRPAEFLMFKLNKKFFIMTDDGTKGDLVYEKWKPTPEKYSFNFWRTGIEIKNVEDIESDLKLPDHEYLFFAARFDNWKRHDRVIKILKKLHDKEQKIHLYFAGGVVHNNYYESIKNLVKDYGLEDYVHFLGAIKQDHVKLYAYNAIANPSMYDVSNLGNVFFEIYSIGSVIVCINDGSLNDYITNNDNGFLINNEDEASEVIIKLLNNKELKKEISNNALTSARKTVLSIDERYDKEVSLIVDSSKEGY